MSTQGWPAGVLANAILATAVFTTNFGLAIWSVTAFGHSGGIGTFFEGSCHKADAWSRWLHIGINILSSALLSGSNYCVQRLLAPRREEVDTAHANGRWLDIGLPSFRNFHIITWDRKILCCLLAATSLPLHLMYNSVGFKTIGGVIYSTTVASPGFLRNGTWDIGVISTETFWDYVPILQEEVMLHPERFETLSNDECVERYSSSIVTNSGDVIAITANETALNDTVFQISTEYGMESRTTLAFPESFQGITARNTLYIEGALGRFWVCSDYVTQVNYDTGQYDEGPCNLNALRSSAGNWTITGRRIGYCLGRKARERCQLQFSVVIFWVVVVCNAIKAGSMFWIFFRLRDEPLTTLGDALSSFLDRPDPYTKGQSQLTKKDVTSGRWQPGPDPRLWYPGRMFWFQAASRTRWIVCLILCFAAIAASAALLHTGVSRFPDKSLAGLMRMGLGSLRSDSLIGPLLNQTLTATVLVVNLPQVIVSFLYVFYNGLLTSMLLSAEFASFGYKRQPLRVTSPRGDHQRSTYWLQLPYAYAVTLIIAMALLHWLISQSIFLANIIFYEAEATDISDGLRQVTGCAYSCIAIVFAIILGSLMVAMLVVLGLRSWRFDNIMPLASSCSIAIAAACHPPSQDSSASLFPVMWGVPVQGPDKSASESVSLLQCWANNRDTMVDAKTGTHGERPVGHCCLTSMDVTPPIPGNLYT